MSLLSSHKTSDSGLSINLHPLALLTISDYITRHTLRRQNQPIVGALIGKQSGRSVSVENAFEVRIIVPSDKEGPSVDGAEYPFIDSEYFQERLQQYKEVHASPQLDLVGWFTTTPASGPEEPHRRMHQWVLENFNETAILLAFHPGSATEGKAVGGKLPLTIYESLYESLGDAGSLADRMDIGEEKQGEGALVLRFREVPYTIETGEAEMIGVDEIARGGGNATAMESGTRSTKKSRTEDKTQDESDRDVLSAEDDELIASITARANAIKMLHARVKLIASYLKSLPPSDLTSPPDAQQNGATGHGPELDYPLLRSIQALLSRLPLLLAPSEFRSFQQETIAEKSDVALVSLLSSVTQGVKEARELGHKWSVIESGRTSVKRSMFPGVGEPFDMNDHDGGLARDAFGSSIMQ